MTTFDEREKEFEARFKHDQELRFKVTARRNRLLGLWAAEQMALTGASAEAYAKEVVEAEFHGGDRHVVEHAAQLEVDHLGGHDLHAGHRGGKTALALDHPVVRGLHAVEMHVEEQL